MNQKQSSEIEPADRFVDAALRERARLEPGESDSELVRSILTATVEKPAPGPTATVAREHRPLDRSTWIVGGAAVAALVALFALVLANLPFENDSASPPEVHLVVNYLSGDTPTREEDSAIAAESPIPKRKATPYRGEFELVVSSPEGAGETLAQLGKTRSGERRESLFINSDRFADAGDSLVYTGNVHMDFRSLSISADEVRLRTDRSSKAKDAVLVASNVSLSSDHDSTFPVSNAVAGSLEIDPATGLIRLRHIERLETLENGAIEIADSQRVSITAAGYAIEPDNAASP